MKIFVTGVAGFIGSSLVKYLLMRGDSVVGVDNINLYYPTVLKYGRLAQLGIIPRANGEIEFEQEIVSSVYPNFRFIRINIEDAKAMNDIFEAEKFDKVVNLAAQAGVRYSMEAPYSYAQSNLLGFLTVLECCRHHRVSYLLYASSSSVYGQSKKVPFLECDTVDSPVSLYAATKRSNELMAHTYSHLYGIRTVGLRFFTVYGPWGRPDMAPMLFANAIDRGEPIQVFNHGNLSRDFTYIDDIVEGTVRLLDSKQGNQPLADLFNIGCGQPVPLMDFICEIEQQLGCTAIKQMKEMQPGDVYQTYASTAKLTEFVGYRSSVSLSEGVARFIAWYRSDKNPL